MLKADQRPDKKTNWKKFQMSSDKLLKFMTLHNADEYDINSNDHEEALVYFTDIDTTNSFAEKTFLFLNTLKYGIANLFTILM